MGTKRPFDEELQEFMKHPKNLDYGNKLGLFRENKFPLETSQNVGIAGNAANFFHMGDGLESQNVINTPYVVNKEFKTSLPLPLVTAATSDPVFCSNLFPEFFEFNLPKPNLVHFDLLNCSPRKAIPIGPNHQADVTEFDPEIASNCLIEYEKLFENSGGERLVGICVIPKSKSKSNFDYSAEENKKTAIFQTDCGEHLVGVCDIPKSKSKSNFDYSTEENKKTAIFQTDCGERLVGVCDIPKSKSNFDYLTEENEKPSIFHTDCECLDEGSIRCVQKHVNEARMKLRDSLGHEKFVELGFLDMGEEEVASKWTEEDEQLFHDIVYSNPVSFWEQLSIAFSSRKKKELVSYYFNVFMLRRRAFQNRSRFLEIDSDDDEWRGNRVEDQDFVVGEPFECQKYHDGLSENGRGDLVPTRTMIEEIFGFSENGESA